MNRSTILMGISFMLFFIFQIMLFKKLVLFNTAFCFIYIAFILLLPTETSSLALMLAAFGLGLLIDVFYDYQGMHAAAAVAVAFFRKPWLGVLTPQGGYDVGGAPTVGAHGVVWFLSYASPLILLHHVILFFIDAGGFGLFGITLAKTFASVIFTLFILLLHQYLFLERSRL